MSDRPEMTAEQIRYFIHYARVGVSLGLDHPYEWLTNALRMPYFGEWSKAAAEEAKISDAFVAFLRGTDSYPDDPVMDLTEEELAETVAKWYDRMRAQRSMYSDMTQIYDLYFKAVWDIARLPGLTLEEARARAEQVLEHAEKRVAAHGMRVEPEDNIHWELQRERDTSKILRDALIAACKLNQAHPLSEEGTRAAYATIRDALCHLETIEPGILEVSKLADFPS